MRSERFSGRKDSQTTPLSARKWLQGGGFKSLMPRCSKASVKTVSQAKSKEPPKTLVSYNQLADENGVGSME